LSCLICDNATETFVDEKTNIKYYHCSTCETIFKSSEYYQNLEVQKERYDLHENKEDDTGYQAYFQRFLDFVLPYVSQTKSALDFGCGRTSLLAQLLSKEGILCDYYDPIYHPTTLVNNKKYDFIVSTEVFEHLHHPKEVFESLVNKLKPHGYLALQTQFHPKSIASFKKWYYHQDSTHIVFFSVESFNVLASFYRCKVIANNHKNMVIIQKI
jgi:2-polyprenyl-3-methyl-5-hydroxy-6-metoxy-1,4-benzoquinol methylase